jgi:ABC-type bacteriocin/lantibiotic exporter with double-glycine peptidase domain
MPWLDVPHQLEEGIGWCLPACVAMVSAFWQRPLPQRDIARLFDTRLIGTPASRVVRLAQRGFDVVYATGSPAALSEWLAQGVPPILFVRTGDLLPHWTVDTPHAVVLAGIEDDMAVLFDPGLRTAPAALLLDNLLLAWLHTDNAYAILRPNR